MPSGQELEGVAALATYALFVVVVAAVITGVVVGAWRRAHARHKPRTS